MSDKSPDAFRTISEVADWLGVQPHVLRFWESKFSQVKPVKRAGGRRYYRPGDMLLLGGIRKLLHEDGLTIKGAQKVLREDGMAYVAGLSQPVDDDHGPYEEAPPVAKSQTQPDVSEVVALEPAPDSELQEELFATPTQASGVEDQPQLPMDPDPIEAQPSDTPAPAFETPEQAAPAPQVEPPHIDAAPEEIAPVAVTTEEPVAAETPLPSFLSDPAPEAVEPEPEVVDDTSTPLPSFMRGGTDESIAPDNPPAGAMDEAADQHLESAPVEPVEETTVEPAAFAPSEPIHDTAVEPADTAAPEEVERVEAPILETSKTDAPAFDTASDTPATPVETAPVDGVDIPSDEIIAEEALVAETRPVPRIIDAPDPDESTFEVHSSAMSAAFSLQSTSADMIAEVTPLIAQLAALRDRMAAQRGR